jgi:hypothetical protein
MLFNEYRGYLLICIKRLTWRSVLQAALSTLTTALAAITAIAVT